MENFRTPVLDFRTWNPQTKKFSYWSLGGVDIVDPQVVNCIGGRHCLRSPFNDAHGTAIYHGDILCFPDRPSTWFVAEYLIRDRDESWTVWAPRDNAVIIGNIFENPDMLEASS